MNWAEQAYPGFFPSHEVSHYFAPYTYRYYPATNTYIGIDGQAVRLLGPAFGPDIITVGTLSDFTCNVFPQDCVPPTSFYASWGAALRDSTGTPPYTPETFSNQTLRQVVRLSLGGDTVRVRLSNRFGKTPVTFDSVHIAKSLAVTSDIDTATDRALTFNGLVSVTIPAGAEALSDPAALTVTALTNLAITTYFASPTAMPTVHSDAYQTAYVSTGNHVSDMTIVAPGYFDRREQWFGLAAVEVSSGQAAKVIVAFGDSLIDGRGAEMDGARRFPDLLDNKLKAAGLSRVGTINSGMGGNRWINDFVGPNGSGRFQRDVLDVAGVTDVIMLMGINDIGFSVEPFPSQAVSANQIIAAIASAAAQAKAHGIKVFLGTLLPFRPASTYSAEGEAKRQAVNAWIRANQDVDGVIDFDLALRDPADPTRLLPEYDSGDHLHPTDAGYAAMANAVDLRKF